MIDDSDTTPKKVSQSDVVHETFRSTVYRNIVGHVGQNFNARHRIMGQTEAELQMIRATLESTGGDKETAANILGIASRTIYRKLK